MENTLSVAENQDWDWEEILLPISQNPNPNSNPNLTCQEEELVDGGDSSSFSCADVIRSNYFSIDTPSRNPKLEIEVDCDSAKEESLSEHDPTASWMDPGQFSRSRVGKRRRNSVSSSSESSDSSLSVGGEPHTDCSHHSQNYKDEVDGVHGNGSGVEIGCEIDSHSKSPSVEFDPQFETKEEVVEVHNSDKENEGVEMNLVARGEEEEKDDKSSSPGTENENENENENEKRSVVWWRVPLEVLKYCVLRVSPVWSLSVAVAALMGFVLYRRRWLSRMKRKTQGIQLNVTVDDKKVSQFMSRAARLNEAFSVVKRVPIIRPSLPAPGFAQWPVVSLR